jgi:hypothetical protein
LEAGVRVLLSEASSLTAREYLSVLGPAGIQVEVASSSHLAIARFSRWCRRVVRYVTSPGQAASTYGELAAAGPVLAQQPATGTYAPVAGLFSHGRLVAVHTSEQVGAGAGGSAAARVSVDHPQPRAHIQQLGAYLGWHGGLTLDYLHQNGTPQYIEANARTVEPGNAAAAGVNLPALTIAISCGDPLPAAPIVGRPGVRTHSSLALMLGAAERTGSRAAALRALTAGLGRRGRLRDSREVLTPYPQTRSRWSRSWSWRRNCCCGQAGRKRSPRPRFATTQCHPPPPPTCVPEQPERVCTQILRPRSS